MAANKTKLIGVIDEGTHTANFMIFQSPKLDLVCSHSVKTRLIHPHEGWVELNPMDIVNNVQLCVQEACDKLTELGFSVKDIVSIGITNQRETTVVWDKYTGKPLYNAIVWNDTRTDETAEEILAYIPDKNKDYFKSISGLNITSYFPALKLRWLQDNVVAVRNACRDKRCLAGTVDSWLVWNLTGGVHNGAHVTDVTNASRTLLMNIKTLNWDPILTKTFGIHPEVLPAIRSSSEIVGRIKNGSVLEGIPISAILANQQASLVGQMCLKRGQAKNTYRSGCFLLMNTGKKPVLSTHGLLTTIAYKMGSKAAAVYALEGSVAIGGLALKWLQTNMEILNIPHDSELLAGSVYSTGDVYFVPAFRGLYAPYWRKDARAVICGLTAYTTKHHITRAALEAICFQTRDLLEVMKLDYGSRVNELHVDGALTSNALLMQLQADLTGIPVMKSQCKNTAALGVAMAAGMAEGINLACNLTEQPTCDVFQPTTTKVERDVRYRKWKMAVERSLGWVGSVVSASHPTPSAAKPAGRNVRSRLVSSIPAALFVFALFLVLVASHYRCGFLFYWLLFTLVLHLICKHIKSIGIEM